MKSVNVHPQKFNSDEILSLAKHRVDLVKQIEAAKAIGDADKVNALRTELMGTK